MKKLFLLLIAGLSIVACKKYDDSELVADIAALEGEVASLQQSNAALAADLASAQAALSNDIAANASDISTIQADLVSLLDMLAEAQSASIEGDAELMNAIADANVAIGNLQGQINSLEGISASYDEATGQVTIILANGTSYSTGDLRGAAGADGSSGSSGSNGLDGLDASEEAILTTGLNTAAGDEMNWLPAFETQIADFVQTVRFSHNFGGNKGVRSLSRSRDIVVTSESVSATTRNVGDAVATYGYGGESFSSLEAAQDAAYNDAGTSTGDVVTITVTNTQEQITSGQVEYTGTVSEVGAEIGSHLVDEEGVTSFEATAGSDISYTIPAAPYDASLWSEDNGVWSNSTVPGYSYTITDLSSLPGGFTGFTSEVTKNGAVDSSLNGSGATEAEVHEDTRTRILADQ